MEETESFDTDRLTKGQNYRAEVKNSTMHLDHQTLLVCLFIWQLFMLLLFVVNRLRYAQEQTSSLFLTAKYLQLAVLILLLLKNYINSPISLPIITLLALAGGTLESLALLMLLRVFSSKVERYYSILFGVSIIVVVLMHLLMPKDQLIIAVACLAGILIIAYPAYILCLKAMETSLQIIMGLLYCAVILTLAGKGFESMYPTVFSTVASQIFNSSFYLGMLLYIALGTAGIMLLYREDSFAEMERVATYDELTGILNRRTFVQRARPLIAASVMRKTPYSFLLLDVDHFKSINDTYGHNTGDHVLSDLAYKIEQQLDNGDLIGRFGGEEFAVLLHRADEKIVMLLLNECAQPL